jgi:hypothetical protein
VPAQASYWHDAAPFPLTQGRPLSAQEAHGNLPSLMPHSLKDWLFSANHFLNSVLDAQINSPILKEACPHQ